MAGWNASLFGFLITQHWGCSRRSEAGLPGLGEVAGESPVINSIHHAEYEATQAEASGGREGAAFPGWVCPSGKVKMVGMLGRGTCCARTVRKSTVLPWELLVGQDLQSTGSAWEEKRWEDSGKELAYRLGWVGEGCKERGCQAYWFLKKGAERKTSHSVCGEENSKFVIRVSQKDAIGKFC